MELGAAQLNDAITAHHAGDLLRAQALYEAVLQAHPQHAEVLHMLGLIAQAASDLTRARALIETSLSIEPAAPRAHYNLAIVRGLQGDVSGAIDAYETCIRLAPDFAEAQGNLGNAYRQTGRRDAALKAYAAAIRAKPNFAAAYSNLATVLIDLERYDIAIHALATALSLAPDLAEAHTNLAHVYRRCGRIRDALQATLRALELRPEKHAYIKLSIEAHDIGAGDLALEANSRALACDPTDVDVYANANLHCYRAMLYFTAGRYSDAAAASEAAIALRPDYAEAHTNLALSLLVRGDFARGWSEYPWIWRLVAKRTDYPYLDRAPLWNGEPFAGRRLLISVEQGFGDAILVARYLPAVKALGGYVILEVAAPLATLFTNLPGVDELRIADPAAGASDFDLQVPLLGLPRAFAAGISSIPTPIPYLLPPPALVERWRPRIEGGPRLRVGIVWAGSPSHINDGQRSCRPDDFAALGAIDGIAWFGLQKGRDEARRSCGPLQLEPLGAQIKDFADTAAILAHLDLVIAVDTAIVHLAGAMGKPVWTLLPFVPDWRWLLERTDSPWYRTMRLFRQPSQGDWSSVFADVARELMLFRNSHDQQPLSALPDENSH